MGDKIHSAISACMLFHIFSMLALSTAVASAITEYRKYQFIENDTREILFLSPIVLVIFTLPIFLLAGDEIVSVITVMLIIDLIACTLGVKIGSSYR